MKRYSSSWPPALRRRTSPRSNLTQLIKLLGPSISLAPCKLPWASERASCSQVPAVPMCARFLVACLPSPDPLPSRLPIGLNVLVTLTFPSPTIWTHLQIIPGPSSLASTNRRKCKKKKKNREIGPCSCILHSRPSIASPLLPHGGGREGGSCCDSWTI